jgi:hypothetical protein
VPNGGADEGFAEPGPRHRAAAVVGVIAGADDRRVADAPRQLAGVAARGSRRGEVAGLVQRHGADRAVVPGEFSLQSGKALGGMKIFPPFEL